MPLKPLEGFSPPVAPVALYEDTHLLVLSKPAGLLSQSDISEQFSLVDGLRLHFGRHYVGLVHRLDRNTSGLMVVAKRSKSAQRLTDALQAGELIRKYTAWLDGPSPTPSPWTWRDGLIRDESTRKSRIVALNAPHSKSALLTGQALGTWRWKDWSGAVAAFELETGRAHQIRAQAAHRGTPILGDQKYASAARSREYAARHLMGTLLHSSYLRFPHPMSGESMEFNDPAPLELERWTQFENN